MIISEVRRKWVWRKMAQNGAKWRKLAKTGKNWRNLAVQLLFLLVKHIWNLTCTFFYASLYLYKTVGWSVRQSVHHFFKKVKISHFHWKIDFRHLHISLKILWHVYSHLHKRLSPSVCLSAKWHPNPEIDQSNRTWLTISSIIISYS